MKILAVENIREADAYTIKHEPIASIDLMERAASNLYQRIRGRLGNAQPIYVFCGTGNNGGDGLVLSRLMLEDGYKAEVYVARYADKYSPDCQTNLERLQNLNASVRFIQGETELPEIPQNALVIDALFGSGLNRPVKGFTAKLIEKINRSGAVVIAVDVPSGLFADKPVDPRKNSIIKADYTYSFQFAKLAFLLPENEIFAGRWEIVPIGLHPDYIEKAPARHHLITQGVIRSMLRGRAKFAHKGNYGHALLIAGSEGKTGAALLAAEACLRCGTGRLHVHIPQNTGTAFNVRLPEAMLSFDKSDKYFSHLPDIKPFNSIGVGPGLGMETQTAKALKLLIQESSRPLVFDADALNILSDNKTWLSFLPKGSILTPHPKEFERLAGKYADGFEHLQLQVNFSVRFGVYVVCKGAHTAISTPDGQCWFNTTGNPGMATAGSGDVLTGVITGLLAQGYSAFEAATLGVYLHGAAGDLAAENQSMEAMLAGDIITCLGAAFKKLYQV